MIFGMTCPICREVYLLYSKLCKDCENIRHLMSIYGKEKIISVLNSNLIVGNKQSDKIDITKSIRTEPYKQLKSN